MQLHDIGHYYGLLDSLEPGTLEQYDAEEAGIQYGGGTEYEDTGGAFGFSAMDREAQAALLRALDMHLAKTSKTNYRTPTSYGLKHDIERYLGRYTSNLQLKVAMRLLGFKRGSRKLNPHFNVTKRSTDYLHLSAYYAEKRRREW